MRKFVITKSNTSDGIDSLSKNLVEIELIKMDKINLIQSIKLGDEIAIEKFTKVNIHFVASIAKQYKKQGLSWPHLMSVANNGLIKAVVKFDENRDFKFISYAMGWIIQSILEAVVQQNRIRIPLNRLGDLKMFKKPLVRCEQENEY